jgi:apolipoprotein N-acyltransferase
MTFPKFFKSSTFLHAAAGAVLLYAALPSVDLWPLAWIAPVPWIMLIRRKELAGPKPSLALWFVGFGFWLATLHWIRLPYWALHFAWLALAGYFALYVPVFIGLSRIAVHQLRWPVMLVAPLVWTGLELARAHLLTGMSMADIAHTQYRWIDLIQVSDLVGQYGVCFAIVFVAACLARMIPCDKTTQSSVPLPTPLSPLPFCFWPLAAAAAMLAALLGYGYWRTANVVTRPGPRVALIQGCIDMTYGGEGEDIRQKFYDEYFALSRQAVEKFGPVDLIVWPEIFYKEQLISFDADACDNFELVKEGKETAENCRRQLQTQIAKNELDFAETTLGLKSPLLIGLDTWHYTAADVKFFNSAAYISKTGELLGRYDKMHLVMFGEYFPFADWLSWLYHGLAPISGSGLTHGKAPVAMDLDYHVAGGKKTVRFAPNICYETVLSRVIRRQINVLQEQGREPELLVNVSNDGWYWNSSELDMLLACSVFRAVECRKPYLAAANTGFSASIAADGRILKKGLRHEKDTLLAEVQLDSRRSFYLQHGDWPAGICLLGCVYFAIAGVWRRYHLRG